jgi:glycosyltransferase involved in cell wall biosynthesis
MTTPCEVSVVIPCFNHGEFLPEAVASVTGLNRGDVELIVVDDGSTDGRTRRGMEALSAAGIRVIRQENKGLASARNVGILASDARYIIPLDADNRLRRAYVEHAIRILDSNPQVGVVYGDAEYIGTRRGRWRVGPFDRDRLMEANYIDACAAYRRSVWEQNRGYDGTMPVQGAEDWDFWLSTLEHGWQFAYVPEVLFDYRVAEQSMLTRLRPFEHELEDFLATKHGLLYRRAWLQALGEGRSVRSSVRHLHRLLISRLRTIFYK